MDTNRSALRSTTLLAATTRRTALSRLAGGGAAILLAHVDRARTRAQATPTPAGAQGEAPNHFAFSGTETRITYDVNAVTGESRLTYDGPHGRHTLTGDMVVTEESTLGQLVNGYLGPFPDQGDLWLTVLLPRFNPMTFADQPAPFKTLAILKWVISTIAGPPRTGALEEYRVVTLEGAAQLVVD